MRVVAFESHVFGCGDLSLFFTNIKRVGHFKTEIVKIIIVFYLASFFFNFYNSFISRKKVEKNMQKKKQKDILYRNLGSDICHYYIIININVVSSK